MKIGVLTGGGDCAGLNAAIRAVVRRSEQLGYEAVGIRHGWAGLLEGDIVSLQWKDVCDIIGVGGTMLKTTRTNPFSRKDGPEIVLTNAVKMNLDAIVAIGGEDTLGVAARLAERGLKVVGVPKTIDNDLNGTDITFGFDSAINVTVDAIDKIQTTGESHNRVMVVEVMGRHSGWIAAYAGVASGANLILTPEEPLELDDVVAFLEKRHSSGATASIVVVGEGYEPKGFARDGAGKQDEFGHARLGGIGEYLAKEIEKRLGIETRAVVLGHVIRGGSPFASDRILATRLGLAAVDAIRNGNYGVMVSLHGTKIVQVPLSEVLGKARRLDIETLRLVRDFRT